MAVASHITSRAPQKDVTRRDIMTALAVSGVALAAPAQSWAKQESPLRALYHRWQVVKDQFADLPSDRDDATENTVLDQMLGLEQQAADFDPETLEDFAFQIIFADDNGVMNVNTAQESLVARAYVMVGIEPRETEEHSV